jgi:hypothetical protein
VLNPNVAGDDNHSATVGLKVAYEFSDNLDGPRLAAHGFQGNINTYGAVPNNTDLNMLGSSVVYMVNDWEALSKYYHFNDNDKIGATGSHKSWAAFMRVGKSFNDWTPYIRFKHAVLSQQDNYFAMQASGQSYARLSLGLRYSLNSNAALKVELHNSDFKAE